MNEPENIKPTPASSTPASDEQNLRAQVDSLLKLFSATLVVLLIISGALNLFLLRQMMTVRKDVMTMGPTVVNYEKNDLPQLQNFVALLQNYAKTHPDFVPVLAKYGLSAPNAQVALPPVTGK